MIYDPITRQEVEIIGRYPPQGFMYRFGEKVLGTFQFARVRYGNYLTPALAKQAGGFSHGEERDTDLSYLVADDGSIEIARAFSNAPVISELVVAESVSVGA